MSVKYSKQTIKKMNSSMITLLVLSTTALIVYLLHESTVEDLEMEKVESINKEDVNLKIK